MQQTKSYWRVVAVAGLVAAFIGSACTVTTSTDDSAAGSAGTSSTVAGTGGTSSTAGTTSTGGSSGSTSVAGTNSVGGGSAGGAAVLTTFQCDAADGGIGKPASCAADTNNTCSVCIATNCCPEFEACYATNPGNQCGYGGPKGDGSGEITCVQSCILAATGDGGVADDSTIETCTNNCVTPKDSANVSCSVVIGQQTSDLVGCLKNKCQPECLGG